MVKTQNFRCGMWKFESDHLICLSLILAMPQFIRYQCEPIVLLYLLVTVYIVYILDMTSHQIAHAAEKKPLEKIQEPNLPKPNLS